MPCDHCPAVQHIIHTGYWSLVHCFPHEVCVCVCVLGAGCVACWLIARAPGGRRRGCRFASSVGGRGRSWHLPGPFAPEVECAPLIVRGRDGAGEDRPGHFVSGPRQTHERRRGRPTALPRALPPEFGADLGRGVRPLRSSAACRLRNAASRRARPFGAGQGSTSNSPKC